MSIDIITINTTTPSVVNVSAPTTQVVTIATPGPQGIQGEQGVPGTGGDVNYVFTQGVPSAVWVITHNLGKYCSVAVVDSANTTCEGSIQYNSPNQLTITFSAAFSGEAYLN